MALPGIYDVRGLSLTIMGSGRASPKGTSKFFPKSQWKVLTPKTPLATPLL